MIIINNYSYDNFPKEIIKKLCIEDKKEMYIYLSIFSKIISLCDVRQKKDKLITSVLCPEKLKCYPDNFNSKLTKNIISIIIALFYLCLAKDECCHNTDPTDCSYSYDVIIESLSTIASFISLYNTFYIKQRECQEDTTDEEDDDFVPNIPII